MTCYTCGKEYKSWSGLFYHKKNIHKDASVHSSVYEYKLKNPLPKAQKCMFCEKLHVPIKMEEHYKKFHESMFKWIKCNMCYDEAIREECIKEHILEHNKDKYFGGAYLIKPEELNDLFSSLTFNEILEKLKICQKERHENNMRARNRCSGIFSRDPGTGELLGFR